MPLLLEENVFSPYALGPSKNQYEEQSIKTKMPRRDLYPVDCGKHNSSTEKFPTEILSVVGGNVANTLPRLDLQEPHYLVSVWYVLSGVVVSNPCSGSESKTDHGFLYLKIS